MVKTLSKKIVAFIMTFVMIATIAPWSALNTLSANAATAGAVTSLSNTDSGIKVKWSKASGKTGYYIYRKANSSKTWKKVKTIKNISTLTWTDTKVSNGNKYFYRVKPYKGSKIYSNSVYKKMYRLNKAVISSASYADVGGFCIISGENKQTSGYQIRYSTSSTFSNYKNVDVYGIKLMRKAVSGLTKNKKYYVKIRAYKKLNDGTYYGPFSKTKSYTTLNPMTVYTKNLFTSIYQKPDTNSTKTTLNYMSKVTLYEDVYLYDKGTYKKLKYNGKYYYTWIPTGTEKFTPKKDTYTYTTDINTKYQRSVIDTAVNFTKIETEYVHNESTGFDENGNGKVGFDCSGFASCVLNTVMQDYGVKTYKLDKNLEVFGKTTVICNDGYENEIKAKKICTGKLDYSKLMPGDILFFNLSAGEKQTFGWNHCGIYLGDKMFIHATRAVDGVVIWPLQENYNDEFVFAIRYIPLKNEITNINKTFVTDKKRKVYPDIKCKSGTEIDTIAAGTEIKIVCTKVNNGYDVAYIEYNDGESGYIYQPPTL